MKLFVNLITTTRFIYTLILPIIKSKVSNLTFIINLILLFLTDSIDGILARKYKVQTFYGSYMDTIADKTLTMVLIIMLIIKLKMSTLILIGELLITLINIYGLIKGKTQSSSMIGKLKMWILSISIIIGYLNLYDIVTSSIYIGSLYITFIFQIITALDYTDKIIKQKNIKKFKINNWNELKFKLFNTQYYLETIS